MSTLERAIAIAADAHAGQRDKGGEAYILHPLRVMFTLGTDTARIVAVLHDLIEDTTWSLNDLRCAGFSADVVDAVDALTRRDGEDYFSLAAGEEQPPGEIGQDRRPSRQHGYDPPHRSAGSGQRTPRSL